MSLKSPLVLGGSAPVFHTEMKSPTARPLPAARLALPLLPFNPSPSELPPVQQELLWRDAVSTAPCSEVAASPWQLCLRRFPQDKHV